MSWSESFPNVTEDELLGFAYPNNVGTTASAESTEQFRSAVDVASDLIWSGVVGPRKGSYNVYLSGHANPKHEKTEGWANDCVTVTVAQA